jgi:hypothetical protein
MRARNTFESAGVATRPFHWEMCKPCARARTGLEHQRVMGFDKRSDPAAQPRTVKRPDMAKGATGHRFDLTASGNALARLLLRRSRTSPARRACRHMRQRCAPALTGRWCSVRDGGEWRRAAGVHCPRCRGRPGREPQEKRLGARSRCQGRHESRAMQCSNAAAGAPFGRPIDRRCRAAAGPATASRKPDPPLSSGRSSAIA